MEILNILLDLHFLCLKLFDPYDPTGVQLD